jgi:hypothetical protein
MNWLWQSEIRTTGSPMARRPKKSQVDPAFAEDDATPKRLAEFLPVPNGERLNPQSIRQMIFDYIVRHHAGDCDAAARELQARRYKYKGRKYRTGISKHTLYKITRDRHRILYLLLEAIAIERRVPVSLLLFYTRLRADQVESNSEEKVNVLIQGLTYALQDAEEKVARSKTIDFDDLAHWIDKFVELSPPEEPTLPGLDLPIQIAPTPRIDT